ncbi:DUF2637 domain-containing protein [Nonomuraea sp. NPDC000554]|uniref:DUF2637 domain-containing protein n=1 Tax=Nonomuraea sp. NPDC000554 TaxID=3154259 RepID=UPI0033166E0B
METTDTAPPAVPKRRINEWYTRMNERRRRRSVPPPTAPRTTGTSTRGDRFIRGFAVLVLLGVAGAAAYVSYHHFFNLALELGERHDMAVLYPAMSDGVIVMASLVMVYCSRRKLRVPVLAWVALALGGVVTLAANVAQGWDGGTGSRLLSALAPVAFVGAYELLMWLIRSTQETAEAEPVERVVYREIEVPVEVVRVERMLPKDRYEAAAWEYEDSLQDGRRRAGRRSLASHWGISEREAETIQNEIDDVRSPAGEKDPLPKETREPDPYRDGDADDVIASLRDAEAIKPVNGTPPPGSTLVRTDLGGGV